MPKTLRERSQERIARVRRELLGEQQKARVRQPERHSGYPPFRGEWSEIEAFAERCRSDPARWRRFRDLLPASERLPLSDEEIRQAWKYALEMAS